MRVILFLSTVILVFSLRSSLGNPDETDSVLIQENVANFLKFVEDIRRPPVIDSNEDLRADVLVTIKNGTLQGKTSFTSIGGKRFYSYTKVPYAKAPVGPELRFEPPQPHDGWGSEIYNARLNSPACAQFMTAISLPATEDCLYLNIHTPRPGNSTRKDLLPVMVFIHGGAFVFGESSYYGPAKLLSSSNEVVFIAMQYRLGAFGFMSTGDSVLPGNMGMKDQVQALRWIQENIEAFGGDPKQVTVFGESAGGASSIYMLISPLAQGLFSKVIAMSGTAIAEWAIDRNPWKSAQRLAGQLGCPNDTSTELVRCMKEAPMMQIAYYGAYNQIMDLTRMRVELPANSPVIEGNVPGAFLPDDPLTLLLEGPLPNVPVVMGAVQNEGTLPVAGFYYLTLERQDYIHDPVYMREQLLGELLAAYGADDHHGGASLSQSVALAFLPDSDRTDFDSMVYELIDLLSVLFMKAPIERTAEILSRRIPNNVYLYSFEYYGTSSLYHLMAGLLPIVIPGDFPTIRPGIMHADDLPYMFPIPLIQTPEDKRFGEIMVELWTNFATHGTPTPQSSARYPTWPAFKTTNQNYLRLKMESEVKSVYSKSWRQGVPQ